ncbi:RHS repeat domain-containing protein [Streptomyces sp. NPDC092359]|uniref:RHS repeat domain-containing protein n=1 Tax=Streptomyces sp. NPDC092359 TaxID=3366014 RepID=UPI003806C149
MPPDPANIETGRETIADTEPLDLEKIEVEKPLDGRTFEQGLETLKVEVPTDLDQAPTGTTTTPAPDTGAFTFGSTVSPASATSTTTTAADDDGLKQIAGLPLLAGQVKGRPAPTGTWQFGVVDRSGETGKGVEEALKVGALVTVQAPATGSVPINVGLKYDKFENLHGADWASRLRLVQFPECYLTTPLEEACQAYEELETANDPVTRTLTAVVDTAADGTAAPASFVSAPPSGPSIVQASYTTATPAASGGDKAVVGAVDSGAGPGGSFKATSLASSGKWGAGGSSGAFTWSYPMTMPAAPAGPAPNVTLSYSSQAVDGKTAVSSPQASWIGEGWDYSPGFIERRYRSCKDDTHKLGDDTPNNTAKADKTSDLCWVSYNAVMSLGGSTTELVRDAPAISDPESGTEIYRPQRDDGTRIEHHSRTLEGSTANGDDNGEYWTVTTTDGTKYHFGLNKVGGGHADTDSVSTVPVFGNHPGEPCHADTFAASRCGTGKQQAWRWGLDKVEDVHGNVMIVNWKQETNHYAVRDKRKTPERYERAAYPSSIEYGIRASDLTKPSATVEFGVEQRCLRSVAACAEANFAKTGDPGAYRPWWDTPGSLNCKSTSKLCPGFPSFWTQLRLDKVTTKAARAGQTGLGYVDVYTLHQSFPEDWYDTAPGLWLNSLTRTGYSPGETPEGGGGTLQSKDGVSFAQYQVKPQHPLAYRKAEPGTPREPHLLDKQLPNLVPTGPRDKRPGFTRPRIGIVATEAGGEIEVEYTGGCQTEPTTDAGKANGTCYPVRWSPDGEEKKPAKAWFNKYVVASVTESDKVANLFGASIKTEYTYSGPAWAQSEDEFVRPALRTHSDWRGYRQVTVTKGGTSTGISTASKSRSVTRYFLGAGGEVKDSIDGTVLLADDAPQYAGMTAESLTYLNSFKKPGEFTTRTRTFPDTAFKTAARPRKAEDGTTLADLVAYRTSVKKTDSIQKIGDSWRGVRSTTLERDPTYNLPTAVETVVVTPKTSGGETLSEPTCTKTAYVHNTTAWLIALPTTVRTTATTCDGHAAAKPATELKSSVRTRYDGLAQGATPTKGLVTGVDTIDGTGTAHSVTTTTTHDPLGRIRTVTKPGAGKTEVQYLPGGDNGGRVDSTKTINAADHTTTTTFDPGRALPLTVTDPNGRVTRTEYDDLGRLIKGWSASRSTGTQSPSVEIAYQPATATTKDTRAAAVTVKTLKDDGTYASQVTLYDGLMRQVQTQSEAHGPGRIVTDTHYNDHGLVSEQTGGYLAKDEPTPELFQVKSPSIVPSRVLTTYDGLERPIRQTPYRGRTAQTPTTTTYHDDTSVTVDPAGSTVPTVTTVTDALGRVTQIKHHTGSGNTRTTSYAYDQRGNREKVTDPAGNAWTYIYDARGRVTSATDPDTGTTETTYDSADRPEIVKDTLDRATRTTYDKLGRITEVATGKTSFTPVKKFTYDPEGALGQLSESKRIIGSDEYVDRVTGYDTEYRPTGRETVIPKNTMTGGLDGTYTYKYTYTPTGKPLSVTLPAKGGLAAEKVITRYNEDGLPESTSGLAWYTSDTTYSPYGEVLRSVSSAQPYRVWTTNFIDEHTGRLQRTVTDRETAGPHRISDTGYAFDASGMITASARQNAETPTLTTWDNQCFTYDAMGVLVNAWTSNITPNGKGTGCKSASGATWGYNSTGVPSSGPVADAPHQAPKNAEDQPSSPPANLADTAPATGTVASGTAVTGSAAYRQSFVHDWIGNRIRKTDHDPAGDTSKNTDYEYTFSTSQPHTLSSVASAPAGKSSNYTYNATGTTKTRDLPGGPPGPDQALEWTPEHKLESNTVTYDDGTNTLKTNKTFYVYDTAGNRILENSPTGSTLYLGETELTTNGTTITRASRSYGQAGAPGVVRTTNGSSTGHGLTALIADHLGTANTAVELSGTGAQAQVVTRRSLKPYGELRGPKPTTWPNKRGYLGVGIDDSTTGLTHIGAREYDQNTGRFLSADPIIDFADPLQMNGYTYSNGNPVSKSDPTGLRPDDDKSYSCTNCGRMATKLFNLLCGSCYFGQYNGAHDTANLLMAGYLLTMQPGGKGEVSLDLSASGGATDSRNYIRGAGPRGGIGKADLIYWTADTVYIWDAKKSGGEERRGKKEVEKYVQFLQKELIGKGDERTVKVGFVLPGAAGANFQKPNEWVTARSSVHSSSVIAYDQHERNRPGANPIPNPIRVPMPVTERKPLIDTSKMREGFRDWWHSNIENHDWSQSPFSPGVSAPLPIIPMVPVF